MPNPTSIEPSRTGGFLIREAVGYLSREGGRFDNLGGTDLVLPAGMVLSMAAPLAATAAPLGANTGTGSIGTIAAGPGATPGTYVVNLISSTGFTVEDSYGVKIAHGVVGTAITAAGLTFTVSAGGTAFLAGDSFTITAPSVVGGYIPFTGQSQAVAILYGDVFVPAGASRKIAVIVRLAEVNGAELSWDPAVIGAATVAQLQASAIASLAGANLVLRTVAPSAG